MLMPAAVLVFVVLGAIAVDSAVHFLGEREAANGASAAAQDVASTLVDEEWYRATGRVRLVCDPERVTAVARSSFDARSAAWLDEVAVSVVSCAGDRVTVRVAATVGLVFATALPAGRDRAVVSATGSAVAALR